MKNKIKLATLMVVGSLALTSAFAAFYPTHSIEREYYAGPNSTQIVGSMFQNCSGRTIQIGQVTPYYDEGKMPCPKSPIEE